MPSEDSIPKPRMYDLVEFDATGEKLNLDAWTKATSLIGDDLDDKSEDHILRGIE